MNSGNEDAAWLAGIIDGEGCLYVRFTNVGRWKSNPTGNLETRVEIHVVSARMIDAIEVIYTAWGVEYLRSQPKMQPRSKRPAIKITVNKRVSAMTLLEKILPFLKVKDKEATAILDFLNSVGSSQDRKSSIEGRSELVRLVRHLKTVA